jgi:uncharacterized secreted protein with C-terminal beta-propeller domain
MKVRNRNVVIILIAFIFISSIGAIAFYKGPEFSGSIKKFSSCDELQNFMKTNYELQRQGRGGLENVLSVPYLTTSTAPKAMAQEAVAGAGSEDYSTTNIQVEGVDEADFVKNDGKYIYVVSGKKIVIVDAFPAENAKILSETDAGIYPQEIFINKDKLVVFGSDSSYYGGTTSVKVYDISDRENPKIARDVSLDGSYFNSRMIGDYVYVIVSHPMYYQPEEPVPIPLPEVTTEGVTKTVCNCDDIYYFDFPDYSYTLTTIASINTQNDDEELNSESFLTGYNQEMYMSTDNIYLIHATSRVYIPEVITDTRERTVIHKIAVKDGKIEYKTDGEVPGTVLNQFSMDEYNGYFRIATTTGHVARSAEQATSTNNVYVLDENLNIVGKEEDLAPGERIYSARFMGERGYLVTFRKVDPLFVIDLADPYNPKVLGKLKIPGYSDYLHPYDENHIIGVGKETVEAEEGDFSWYQGVKLSLFDVSDVENPKEISKLEIGDRGTDSYALSDHKAFLFSKDKNLLVIPILLAEIDEEKYPQGVPSNMPGEYVWQGAYVLDVSLENGLVIRGRIGHADDESFLKSGYYYYSPYSVKRSLYIDGVLYTLSDKMIKMNDLNDLEEINSVELPYESTGYYPYR